MSREEEIKSFISGLDKRFGTNSVMRVDQQHSENVPVIPSGLLALDDALGIGGYPRGRIIEAYGPESSGKTTLLEALMGQANAMGELCALVDVEQSFDLSWAKKLGVESNKLYICQPETGESALELTESLVRSGFFSVVGVDSVAALVPKAEIEGEMGDSHMGLQARLMSQAMRKLVFAVKESNTVLFFTNQLRQKIGVIYGSPEVTTGGNALKFYASIRIDVRKKDSIIVGNVPIGNAVDVTVKKNKLAPPFRKASFNILYEWGLDYYEDIISMAIAKGFIQVDKAWSTVLPGTKFEKKVNGRGNIWKPLSENKEMYEYLLSNIRTKMGLPLVKEENNGSA